MRAYARHLRTQLPFLVFSLGFTVLAVVNSLRSSSHQLGLPGWGWGLIALACLNVAQFLVWRDVWVDDVAPDHSEKLRDIAKRLLAQLQGSQPPTYPDEALAAWAAEHMFRAHFPKIAEAVASYAKALTAAHQAREALIQDVFKRGAFERFGQAPGWSWGGIAQRCETHLQEIIEGKPLDIQPNAHSKTVAWTATVVFDVYGLSQPDGAAEQLKEWVSAIGHSSEADAYRTATTERAAFSLAALHLLDPVIHGQRIRRARRCQICFPPRR